jgi:hypothetical protein
MTPAPARLMESLEREKVRLRQAREHVEWLCLYARVPAPLLFLARVGIAVTLVEAKRENREGRIGPGRAAVVPLAETLMVMRAIVQQRMRGARPITEITLEHVVSEP